MQIQIKKCMLLVLLMGSLSACTSMSDNLVSAPRVQLSNVQVVGLGFQNQTFLLSFDVANPNSFPLPVRNIGYGVKLDGQRFASGQTSSEFTVPAHGDASFAISVDLNLLQTAPQLLYIVRDGTRREIPYELEGRFGIDLPLMPSIKYRSSGMIRLSSDVR